MAVSLLTGAFDIARKDVAIELRTRSAFLSAIVFSILAASVFHFAFDLAAVDQTTLAPGAIWVIFTFTGLLGLQRSFALEISDRAIDGLLSSPVERGSIFLGKMAASCLFVLGVQCFAVPAVMVLFNVAPGPWLVGYAAIMLLAVVGMTSVGTLFSSMAVNTRLAELMLPVLALPFFLPVVAMSAASTELILAGRPLVEIMPSLRVLIAFDLVFVTVSWWTFEHTIEA